MKQTHPKLHMVRQALLWIPPGQDRGGSVKQAPPVPFEGPEPDLVWTLYGYRDETVKPPLPYRPIHNHNAFLEDFVHDWNVQTIKRKSFFCYASRVVDGGVWLLLEYKI